MNDTFEWDGDKIRNIKPQIENKFSVKELIEGLDQTRANIAQMKQAIERAKEQIVGQEKNLKHAMDHEKKLAVLEDKALEIQKESLLHAIATIKKECFDFATKRAKVIIDKDPLSMTEEQKIQLPYLEFQKALATHDKISKKISKRVIGKLLYEEPIFENPFV